MTILRSFLLAALLPLARQPLVAQGDSIVVIANGAVSVTEMGQDDVREIFLGTQHSLSKASKITPVILKGGPTHETFLRLYLQKSPEAFRAWWMQYIFTGQGLLPKTFASEADLVGYVGRTRGAVGYATRASVRGNVKCILITPKSNSNLP
jgi:ABC-type phosphate transport system substrate-binding protein